MTYSAAASVWNLPSVTVHHNMAVPMRDGVNLATDIYIPKSQGPLPALIMRTPYEKGDATETSYAHAAWYAQQGFAVLCQDVRGRWASSGDFLPFANEAQDGHDTIAWTAAQPWCNGRVGMYGFSYPGATQMLAAADAPDSLVAFAPAMTGSSYCENWTFRKGTFELAFILSWAAGLARDSAVRAGDNAAAAELTFLAEHPQRLYDVLPLRSGLPKVLLRYAPYLSEWMAHPDYDDYWQRFSPRENYSRIKAPALHIAGWYDSFLAGTLENFAGLQEAGNAPQRLVVGPWYHMPWSQYANCVDFGDAGRNTVDEVQRQFFAQTLQGAVPEVAESSVQMFIMGANRWDHFPRWSPRGRSTCTLFLASDGRANSSSGTGKLALKAPPSESHFDAMPCNPLLPVNSVGGRSCCSADLSPMGPADQRSQEVRNDVLVYTSDVLTENLLVIGEPTLIVHIATNAPSVDVIARLTDVHPDGASIGVSDGVHRLKPGEASGGPLKLTITMAPTAICFKAGHRIRLTLAGSDFPARDRNPNNGASGLDATWSDFRVATQAVFHDGDRPSRLLLPLV